MFKTFFIIIGIFVFSSCKSEDLTQIEGVVIDRQPLAEGSKICIIGDSGTGEDDQTLVADALANENCLQVKILGDVIYPDGISSVSDSQLEKKFFKPYQELIENQKVPFSLVMGNHDHHKSVLAWLSIAQKNPLIVMPSLYYLERYGDICFYHLDSNTLLDKQILWMDQVLENDSAQCLLKVSLAHHPYFSVGGHGDAQGEVKEFLEETVIGKMNLHLAGHDHHLSDEGSLNGTRLLVSGSAGKLRPLGQTPRVYAESKLGYLVLTVRRSAGNSWFSYDFTTVNSNGDTENPHSGTIVD